MIKKDEDKIIGLLNDKVETDIDLKSNFINIRSKARDSISYNAEESKKAFKPRFAIMLTSILVIVVLGIVAIPIMFSSKYAMQKNDAFEGEYAFPKGDTGNYANKDNESTPAYSDVSEFRYLNVDEMTASDLEVLLNKLSINTSSIEDGKTYEVYCTEGSNCEYLTFSNNAVEETYQINAEYKILDIYNQITKKSDSTSISVYVDGDSIIFYDGEDKTENILVK